MASRRCLACGRPLTNPASIKVGYGPKCREKIEAAVKEEQAWGEVASIVDRDLADRSLAAVWRVVRDLFLAHPDRKKCSCGRDYTYRCLEHCDHGPGGFRLPGFATEQWIYLHCDCTYDMAVWKIGVTQDLIDQALDWQRGKKQQALALGV